MNRGIIRKATRELLPITLLLGVILLLVELVLAYVLPTFSRQFSSQILRLEFIRTLVKAMLGADLGQALQPPLFASIAWVHPVVLALVWAHAIILCTRIPARQ